MRKPRRRSLVSCRTTSELVSAAAASLHRKVLCPECVAQYVLLTLLLVCQIQMSRWLFEQKHVHVSLQDNFRIVSECRERLETEATGLREDLTRSCTFVARLQARARCVSVHRCVLSGSSGES